MNRLGRIALSTGAASLAAPAAYGQMLVYESVNDTVGFIQQTGNNLAYYGDDVHLAVPCPQIAQVYINFGYFTYDAETYTPILQVDLWNLDSNGLPQDSNTNDAISYTPIATAFNTTAVLTGSNYNNGGKVTDTKQTVRFDFTGQSGAVNLQDFAFGYRDINPAGTQAPAYNFSVFVTSLPGSTTTNGSTDLGFLQASPNNVNATTFTHAGGYNIEASVTCVPEPASFGLIALGGLMALRRPKEAR